jgi:serine/threonine protein kinase
MLFLKAGLEIKDRYVVQTQLGSGGYASVWKATDQELRRDVAIKRLNSATHSSQNDISALKEEAQKHAQLLHPNIVQVYDIIQADGELLLVLEYVDGQSLHALLCEKAVANETLPLDHSIQILHDVLLGIACAHANGICHRDLSPMNILLSSSGIPKIADFGIARVISDRTAEIDSAGSVSQGGTGNPSFMSPEQARGEPAGFASDLFMAGIVGYLLLTGRHPYAHPSGLFTIPELLKKPDHNPDIPKAPSNISPRDQQLYREYAAIVMRLLHREKAGRYPSAQEAAEAWDDVTPYLECPYCQERVPDHSKFCSCCGKPLLDSEPAVSTQQVNGPTRGDQTADELVEEGFRLTRVKNWNASVAQYRRALTIDPDHEKAHWNLAFALNRLGQYQAAVEIADQGLCLLKDQFQAGLFYERGFALMNLKRYDEAMSDIDRALDDQPKSTKYLYLRALLHQLLGNKLQAREDANEVLRRDPDHIGASRIVHGVG